MQTDHIVAKYDLVKVFVATKSRDRESLGEKVTLWLRGYEGKVVEKIVKQSSDAEFHCLSITLFCQSEPKKPRRVRRRRNGG